MHVIQEVLLYVVIFSALYLQVFLLVSFFWSQDEEETPDELIKLAAYEPVVAIMVPCWNEERTVERTLQSLAALDYPREKLNIVIIDDGSTDNTWGVLQQYKDWPSVVLLQKQNEGSKFAALNFGLKHIEANIHADIIGCLDADSTVDPQALHASLRAFARDPEVMGVMPAMSIDQPKSIWQHMQKVEYEMMTFGKQVFHNLSSIFVAPGPFALFRREVFETLGGYNEAYHTEDLEICLRMIKSGMKLAFAPDSLVYTHGPKTFSALVKQRIRWIYGFIKNMQDFRSMLFAPKYGHVGMLILPVSLIGMFGLFLLVPVLIVQLVIKSYELYERISITGIQAPSFSWFYINTSPFVIIAILSVVTIIVTVMIGRSILRHKKFVTVDLLTFIFYSYASLYWTFRAVLNSLTAKKGTWR